MKNIISYKQFLLEKEQNDQTDIMKKLFVDDPNNPLDKSINSILDRFNKKTDIYTKTSEGKEIYIAKMYRQLKAVDLEEIIIQKKIEYFIQNKKEQVQNTQNTQNTQTSENYHINEGFLKKMFDFAVKKTKLFAAKLKVSKKIDPIFENSKQEINKLFNNKKMIESYEKANSNQEELVKKLKNDAIELKKELLTTTKALEDALNKKAQKEKGENAFKKGEIYTYELENGNKERIVITNENPVEFIRVSTNDNKNIIDNKPLDIKNIDNKPIKPHINKISKIGDDKINDIEKEYKKQIDYVKNKYIQKEKK